MPFLSVPSPRLSCPGQSKYHRLRWGGYSAGLSLASRGWAQLLSGLGVQARAWMEGHRHQHRNWAFFKGLVLSGPPISPLLWEAEDDLVLLF